jgi:hypothetical protein
MSTIAGARLCAPDNPGGKMKNLMLGIAAIGLAFLVASPADAAKKSGKHKKSATTVQAVQYRQTAGAVSQPGAGYQGGVMRGPLYNGPDYIGDDPDPNIRARLMKDMTRYQGSY